MAEVRLMLADLQPPENLPRICVRCGRPATGIRSVRLLAHEPRRDSSWGCLLWIFGFWTRQQWQSVENYRHAWKITKGKLRFPVCWRHRWIFPLVTGATLENEIMVKLSLVGADFVAGLKKQGKLR